jgi:hypothetical protein
MAEMGDRASIGRYGLGMKKLSAVIVVSAIALAAGCSSSSSSGNSTPTSPPTSANPEATDAASKAAATTQIKQNWATFFKSSTPHATSVGLLQNGSGLGAAIAFAAHLAKTQGTKESATVKTVTFTSPTQASVKYVLYGNGTPLLPNADGVAVLDNGTWKVSQATFCGLVNLGAGNKKIAGCTQ